MEVGLRQFWHDLLHRRYRFRQFAGGVFAACLVLLASPTEPCFWVGASLAGMGALVRLWAAGHVRKSKELATRGPYAFVRHPQYMGNSLVAVGLSVASGYPWAIGIWGVLFWLLYLPAIRCEEEKLMRRFGESWEKWARKTAALVPTWWPRAIAGLHLADWSPVRAMRNGELVWLLCVAGGLVFIWAQLQ